MRTTPRADVFYDAGCSLCTRAARRFEHLLDRHAFRLVPLQAPGASALLGVREDHLLDEMRVRLRDGRVFGGADAMVEIARRIWWAWPVWAVSRVPGVLPPMRAVYRAIAARRTCTAGVCGSSVRGTSRLNATTRRIDYGALTPVIVLPLLALVTRGRVPDWAFMWTMAAALYASCKWLTYRHADERAQARVWRRVAYLVAWPGMDATAFLNDRPGEVGRALEWLSAVAKTTLGLVLLWAVAPLFLGRHDWLAGWIGMAGVVFVLHFGLFHLLSLAWRQAGVDAKPIMRNPLRSASLAEFWGRRWNIAFHELAVRFTFTPLRQVLGLRAATVAVFLASGLVHELVITLPARDGYGLPTLYFLLQAVGLVTERSAIGRQLGLGHGVRGWTFAAVTAAAPAVLLFPPPFIHRVVVPMLGAISA